MAMSIAAVLAGNRSFYAIGQWIAGAKQKTLKALGARRDPDSGRYVGPDEKTVRRLCATVDGDALDGALGNWLVRRRHLALAARARRGRTGPWRDGRTTSGTGCPRRSKEGFSAIDQFTWGRLMRWTRAKHAGRTGLSMKELRRRFCDTGWRFAHNGVVFTGASSVAVTRYRHRGSNIPTPWTPKPAAATGS